MTPKNLIGQKDKPLNLKLFNDNYRIELRKRGIHPSMADREHYDDITGRASRLGMNLEREMSQAKHQAELKTRQLQDMFPSLNVNTQRYNDEFIERIKSG